MFIFSMIQVYMLQHGNFEISPRTLQLTTVHCNSFKNSKLIVTIINFVNFVKKDQAEWSSSMMY